jgi:acetyl-CoA C-acetyltransferase
MNSERIPVIVAVGEVKDRPADMMEAQEPLALMAMALQRAEDDAGAELICALDSLAVVNVNSWPYPNAAAALCEKLEITPHHCQYGELGGHTPVRLIHEAAQRIANGASDVVAIVGAEASYALAWAQKNNRPPPWPSLDKAAQVDGYLRARPRDYVHRLGRAHGLTELAIVYPLFENAAVKAWGVTPADAQAESARLWAKLSETASRNPNAWVSRCYRADEISRISTDNRPIAFPYPKLMTANPAVNHGAAIILMSLGRARAMGLDAARFVYVWGGAAAAESQDWLSRPRFDCCVAQEVVLDGALEQVNGDASRFHFFEIYSCFPVVPKLARRHLKLPENLSLSAAGGLTFHGAPLSNYMTHGAAALVRGLRRAPESLGLLYGQGGHLTSHHALALGSARPAGIPVLQPFDRQSEAETRQSPAPAIMEALTGPASVETFTVIFGADSAPERGAVVVRLPDGSRSLARVAADDRDTLGVLMNWDASPVGLAGHLAPGRDGLAYFRL